ncbi:MAG: putative bifunctional diguanylate cyclase/phosphodiesterase [Methyloligellaceae bacterium]
MKLLGKSKVVAAFVVLAVSLTAAVFVGQRYSEVKVAQLLRQDVENVASKWATFLVSRPADLAAFVEGGEPGKEILSFFRYAGISEQVLRYRVLDAKGGVVFSSESGRQARKPSRDGAVAQGAVLPGTVLAGNIHIALKEDRTTAEPRRYGEAYIPVFMDGHLKAAIQVDVDETALAASLAKLQTQVARVTGALIIFCLLLPFMLLGFYYRERLTVGSQIRRLATHDALTGLPKRELFLDELQPALERRTESGEPVAVLYIDLDRFKEINDTLGHATGDALLEQFAARLRANTRKSDMLCRLSGDEFAVGLVSIDGPDEILSFAERLSEILSQPYLAGGHEVVTSVSVGVAVAPGDGDGSATLLRKADLALCRAKDEGRRQVRRFEPEMEHALVERRAIEQDLRTAIDREEFELHYQPILDLKTGKEVAREALMRWRHPEKGLVAPNAFIQVAEETGQIAALSAWTLQTACAAALEWRSPLNVAVNFSPVQFSSQDIPELVRMALERSGLPPGRLEVEITESVLLRRSQDVIEQLKAVKGLGVSIVMDDFGTGYSSLSYLTGFPFDKIKIDRSFIWEMESDPRKRSIVEMIVKLGRSLDVSITAEGIETEEQQAFVQKAGCVMVQGYLFSPPVADPESLKLGGTPGAPGKRAAA